VLHEAAASHAAPVVHLAVAAGSGRELWDEPVESWIDVPPGLEGGPFLALSISGDSMVPLVHTGDTVLVRVSPVVRANSVVVARHPEDGYLCKWVRSIARGRVTLASLDPARADVVIPHDRSLIVGTVVMAWCHHAG
jgi:phage repressor protein C with HTH and peptisase S24 domain